MTEWTKNQRKVALINYKNNPTICFNCGCCLIVRENDKVAIVKNKKFCSSTCSAKTSNQHRIKHKIKNIIEHCCNICGKKTSHKFIPKCKICIYLEKQNKLLSKTKKELLETVENGRWDLYRVRINRHATRLYRRSDKPKFCVVCQYNKTFEVAHIKAVASFSEESTLGEINSLENLIALCPNHHWEYDNDLILLPENGCGEKDLNLSTGASS